MRTCTDRLRLFPPCPLSSVNPSSIPRLEGFTLRQYRVLRHLESSADHQQAQFLGPISDQRRHKETVSFVIENWPTFCACSRSDVGCKLRIHSMSRRGPYDTQSETLERKFEGTRKKEARTISTRFATLPIARRRRSELQEVSDRFVTSR